MRIGLGYDVHRLEVGYPLILGGVAIPFAKGLVGHSDADVLSHALMDALLGALGEGDIGGKFPDKDPSLRGISSLLLLERVMEIVRKRGYGVHNVDAVLIAQAPRLAPHYRAMREKLAPILGLDPARVSIKATTTEGLGFPGRGEGIAAQVVVLLHRPLSKPAEPVNE
ncbi:MAG: 2-C-methyl-D-erythritol 2,4-cyclodiphosphate synthase [Firmicutes bacterium]|nr:2-C-methyl-D-erythritol 2,4-cyclodiphosphate synthase [Bacillota bacterium]